MRDLLPYLGDRKARSAWDEVFSRDMLGAVLVGAAAGKVVEKLIALVALGTVPKLGAWGVAFVVFVLTFVFWHRLAEAAEDAKETVEEKAEGD